MHTYRFRIKNLDPSRTGPVEKKEIIVEANSHAQACDLIDREATATYWHPDAFLGSDDPNAPARPKKA